MSSQFELKQFQKVFVIAEIGQNHQGDLELAKELINRAKESGADCVKFQKSDLNQKFTKSALDKPYISPNSFGKTYGEHKAFLEFNEAEFKDLQQYAKNLGILFTASAMDLKSLQFLISIEVPFIKIGSGDADNFVLIEEAAKSKIPLVVSTGMQNFETVKEIHTIIHKYHDDFALLHCVSSYPTPYEEINLNVIQLYRKEFPGITIGYSGHEVGTHVSLAAVALGSKVIERHITLDNNMKGSDHKSSLEIRQFAELVKDIRTLEKALGKQIKIRQHSELLCYEKLGKTLVYTKSLNEGTRVQYEDLYSKVAVPKGITGNKIYEIIGKTLKKGVQEDESVQEVHFS